MTDKDSNIPDEEPISLEPDEPQGSSVVPELSDEPISLVEPADKAAGISSVRAFGAAATQAAVSAQFTRPLNVTGSGATRCRMFHSRIAVAPLEYMQKQINEWIDGEKIEVKHVGHVIGIMEGKVPEPNLVVVVWY